MQFGVLLPPVVAAAAVPVGLGWVSRGKAWCRLSAGCGPSRLSAHRALQRNAAARQVRTSQSLPAFPCLQMQSTVGFAITVTLSCSAQSTAPKLNIVVILNG